MLLNIHILFYGLKLVRSLLRRDDNLEVLNFKEEKLLFF